MGGGPNAALDPERLAGIEAGLDWTPGEAGAYELLCVKPGKGSLSVDGVALVVKDAKPLPASD